MRLTQIVLILFLILSASSLAIAGTFDDALRAGEAARVRGEFELASKSFGEALEWAENGGEVADARIGLGHVAYLKASYLDAVGHFRSAEKAASDARDERRRAVALAYLGQLYWRVGKIDDGEELLMDALSVFESLKDDAGRALAMRMLGRLHNGRANRRPDGTYSPNNPAARRFLEPAIEIYERLGDLEGRCTALKDLGITYQIEDPERAVRIFDEIRTTLKDTEFKRLYALALNNLASNALNRARYDEVYSYAFEALALFRKMNDWQEALEMIDRILETRGRSKKDFAQSGPLIEEAVAINRRLTAQRFGGPLDRQYYFQSMETALRWKMLFAVSQKRLDLIFEAQEQLRSVALLDQIRRPAGRVEKPLLPTEVLAQEKLEERIRELNRSKSDPSVSDSKNIDKEIRRARLLLEETQGQIAAKYDEPLPVFPETLSFSEMCREIKERDTAVIKYETRDESVIRILLMTRRAAVPHPFFDAEEIPPLTIDPGDGAPCSAYNIYHLNEGSETAVALLANLHRTMEAHKSELVFALPSHRTSSRFLYDQLFAKLEPMLRGVKRLVIMPNGAVSTVKFEALIAPSGRYLLEDFAISYAPTFTVMRELRRRREALAAKNFEGEFFALGNPRLSSEVVAAQRAKYRNGKLEDLPEAAAEVRTIGGLYKSRSVLTGANATETAFRNAFGRFRVLHLATHGISDVWKPMYSHVLLGADDRNDGLVEGWEIAREKIEAEMVVLSACETDAGRNLESEGIVGLAWSFQAAGVPTVIASRWKVDSAATSRQMIDFYKNLKSQDQPPPEALRTAALKIMKNRATSHPFYWAAFSVYGSF